MIAWLQRPRSPGLWLRPALTFVFVVGFVLTLPTIPQPPEPLALLALASTFLSAVVACWRPLTGALLSVLPLTMAIVQGPTGLEWLPMAASAVALYSAPRGVHLLFAVGQVAWVVALFARGRVENLELSVQVLVLTVLPAWVLGAWLRSLNASADVDARQIRRLSDDGARIRSEERSALAWELHDVVTNHLAAISLQLMVSEDSRDVPTLRGSLDGVDESARSALAELRVLVSVLREDSDPAVRDAGEPLLPSRVASDLLDRLTDAGFEASCALSAGVDQLDQTSIRTTNRALDAMATGIIRRGRPGSPCSFRVDADDERVVVVSHSELDPASRARREAWDQSIEFRSLRERLELMHGSLTAAMSGNRIVITAASDRPL